jgi:hypothetical protein
MALVAIVLVSAFIRWNELFRIQKPVTDSHGDLVLEVVEE